MAMSITAIPPSPAASMAYGAPTNGSTARRRAATNPPTGGATTTNTKTPNPPLDPLFFLRVRDCHRIAETTGSGRAAPKARPAGCRFSMLAITPGEMPLYTDTNGPLSKWEQTAFDTAAECEKARTRTPQTPCGRPPTIEREPHSTSAPWRLGAFPPRPSIRHHI